MQPLSPRQRRCLEAVLAHRRRAGLPPTYRELGRALSIASTNGVRGHLKALERKGYLRLGAWVCGAPAYDPDFACADFYILLSLDRIDPRYMRHFLGETT